MASRHHRHRGGGDAMTWCARQECMCFCVLYCSCWFILVLRTIATSRQLLAKRSVWRISIYILQNIRENATDGGNVKHMPNTIQAIQLSPYLSNIYFVRARMDGWMDGWRLKRKGKEMLPFDACLSAARIAICKSVLHSSPRYSTNTRPRFTKSIIPDGYVSSEQQQSWNSQPTQRALVDEGWVGKWVGRKILNWGL